MTDIDIEELAERLREWSAIRRVDMRDGLGKDLRRAADILDVLALSNGEVWDYVRSVIGGDR